MWHFAPKKIFFAFMFSEFFSTQKKHFFLFLLFFVYLKSANLYAASAFFILCRANNCACSLMSCKKLRKPSIKFFLLLIFLWTDQQKKIFFFFDSCRDTKGKTQSICRWEEQFIRQKKMKLNMGKFSKSFHLFFY